MARKRARERRTTNLASDGVDVLSVPFGLLHDVDGYGSVLRLDIFQSDVHSVAVGRVLCVPNVSCNYTMRCV